MRCDNLGRKIILAVAMVLLLYPEVSRGDQDYTIEQCRQILRYQPSNVRIRLVLAELLVGEDRHLEAIEQYEVAERLQPDNVSIHKKLAQLYSWNNQQLKAIEEYQKVLELDPGDVETMKTLAQHYFWTDQPLKGIALLEKILIYEPDNLELRRQLAQQYSWNGMPKKAIEEYKKVIAHSPKDLVALKALAQNYFASKQPRPGLKIYKFLLKVQPDSLSLWREYAQQSSWNGEWEEAVRAYRVLLSRDPADTQIRMELAQTLMWAGRQKEAAAEFEKIIELQPENIDAHFKLAQIRQWQPGGWKEAKKHYELVLRLNPNHQQAKECLERIRKDHGPLLQPNYYYVTDTNDLTKQWLILKYQAYVDSQWQYHIEAGERALQESKLAKNYSVNGDGGALYVKRNLTPNSSLLVGASVYNYSSQWNPLSWRIQVENGWFDRLYATIRYQDQESLDGALAVQSRIRIKETGVELSWENPMRANFSGSFSYGRYSDGNSKYSFSLFANVITKIKDPKISLVGYFSYESFRHIYPLSIPYWTPKDLFSKSIGLDLKHRIARKFLVGWGYSIVGQNTHEPLSNNFRGKIRFNISKFTSLYVEYFDFGSSVYYSKSLTCYFQHRF